MSETLPSVSGYTRIETLLDKMKEAPVPDTFSHDFLKTKLGLKSSTYHAMIPLLKKLEFLDSGSKPTRIYVQWKDSAKSRSVMGNCIKKAYSRLYEYSEYVHDLPSEELKEKIIMCLNTTKDDERVKTIFGTLSVLINNATFDNLQLDSSIPQGQDMTLVEDSEETPKNESKLGICYTINLHLPPSDDKAVFDAIFQSLRKNLL